MGVVNPIGFTDWSFAPLFLLFLFSPPLSTTSNSLLFTLARVGLLTAERLSGARAVRVGAGRSGAAAARIPGVNGRLPQWRIITRTCPACMDRMSATRGGVGLKGVARSDEQLQPNFVASCRGS